MSKALKNFLSAIKQQGECANTFSLEYNGEIRHFKIYRWGNDSFILQREAQHLTGTEIRRPVMMIKKEDLRIGRKGWVFLAALGNFSATLIPLFSGLIPGYCAVPKRSRTEVLQHRVVLANLTQGIIDVLQRDTDLSLILEADQWLQSQGLALNEILFMEHSSPFLTHMSQIGQVWRIRPTVYTVAEKKRYLQHAWMSMETQAHYFSSVKGVYYLTYAEFYRLAILAKEQPEAVKACLREWCALGIGQRQSHLRRVKYGVLHVIEFFGIARELAEVLIIPSLERLLEGIMVRKMEALDISETLQGIALLFYKALFDPAYASNDSTTSVNRLYMLMTNEQQTGAVDFDARRIALPGVTFIRGVAHYHPGVDGRTQAMIEHVMKRLNFRETIESLNVYEIRSEKTLSTGVGQSREIVIKTDRQPLPLSYIEKRLGSVRVGYASYLQVRANLFQSLGVTYPTFELLMNTDVAKRSETPYFMRTRCPGEPLASIPDHYLRMNPKDPESPEDPDVLLALAHLYGNAAAQNYTVKKFIPDLRSCRFGKGKEIFEFTYDPFKKRPMPNAVRICSIRGALGWPDLAKTQSNLDEAIRFYLRAYATALSTFWHLHSEAITVAEVATEFFNGFEQKMQAMRWTYQMHRESFDTFDPHLREVFQFRSKLDFALWALMTSDIAAMRELFMDVVRSVLIKV